MRKAIQQLEEENELLKNQIEELKEDLLEAKDNYKSLEWYNNNQHNLLKEYKKFINLIIRKKVNWFHIYAFNAYEQYKEHYIFSEYHADKDMLTEKEFNFLRRF